MSNRSKFIKSESKFGHRTKLIKTNGKPSGSLQGYNIEPEGTFGRIAIIKCGSVTINSKELDVEFTIPFDDDMEANEADITVYNLTDNTINALSHNAKISIEAGYKEDTGVIFIGYIDKVTTEYKQADKITKIKAYDDISNMTVENLSFSKGTKASYILKSLLNKTGTPIAVFNMRRDWTYENNVTVDGDLMSNIKKYAQVCGVSVYVNKGKIYARYLKEGDNLNFTVSEETGMINTPSSFEEEKKAEDYTETVKGYNIEMLLQHRISAGAIIKLKSRLANGTYRVQSGQHTFSDSQSITKIKVY